jgi:putative hemolysin
MTDVGFLMAAIFLLLLGNGFFSGSEIAIISARRSKIDALASEGSRAAKRVKELQDDPETFLAVVQIGVTLMGTLAGVLGGYLASRHVEPALERLGVTGWMSPALGATLIVGGGIVYVELVLGELVPKALAIRFSETVALVVAWPLRLLARVSHWLVVVLTASTRAVLALVGLRDLGNRPFVSEDEIKHMVREGREQGVLDQTKVDLIHSVFEFSETPVKKVMVPRPKIFALDAETPPEDVGRMIVESGFSRIPVYQGSIDNVLGLVYVKDALRLMEKHQPVVLRKVLHPVLLVPETKKVGPLLKELQKRRSHLALVIDEHGSATGLVTMEDLLEEIVGEIQDEYDWEERPVERQRDGSLIVDGTVFAAELRDSFQVPIPESPEFETVAGFMLERLGSVPRGGEVVTVGDYRLTVVDVERHRISKVKVDKAPVAVKA